MSLDTIVHPLRNVLIIRAAYYIIRGEFTATVLVPVSLLTVVRLRPALTEKNNAFVCSGAQCVASVYSKTAGIQTAKAGS